MISLGIIEGDDDEYVKAKDDLKNAQLNLRETQRTSQDLHQEHLMVLAEKRAAHWEMKAAEAMHILNE